jgi:exonuclease VII small subunit
MLSRVLRPIILMLLLGGCGSAPAAPPEAPEPGAKADSEAEAGGEKEAGGEAQPQAPVGQPPAPAAEQAPSSLERDEDELGAALERFQQAKAALAEAEQRMQLSQAERKRSRADSRGRKAAPAAAESSASRCTVVCEAFASLERAAQAVCRLVGDSDERCTRARQLVEDSRLRIAACGCQP